MTQGRITGVRSGGVATITLDHAPLNVLTLAMTREFSDLLDAYAADPEVRVLVITGSGERAFCAGSDVKEFPELQAKGTLLETKLKFENDTYGKVADFPKPTIAALNGIAYGGGLELAVCCDFVVAGSNVRLALPEIHLGVFPGSGGTFRVPRRIGATRAKELMFFGTPIDADTALSWGLINRIAEAGQALAMAMEMAETLALRSSTALVACKAAITSAENNTQSVALDDALDLVDRTFATPDCIEGIRAFFAKETPRFNQALPKADTRNG